jgi:hypothetical protein|tara:strand:+ start:194 stop:601 length:408 start_codon:yes stop_codon:yes gene_type:complete
MCVVEKEVKIKPKKMGFWANNRASSRAIVWKLAPSSSRFSNDAKVVKRRKNRKRSERKERLSVTFLQKHHPQTTIMLRRSAVQFAERALASSSRTRASKLATTAQKRAMGAFFFVSFLFFLLLFLLEREKGKSIV